MDKGDNDVVYQLLEDVTIGVLAARIHAARTHKQVHMACKCQEPLGDALKPVVDVDVTHLTKDNVADTKIRLLMLFMRL